MIVVLKGLVGRGINGVCEMRIETSDKIDLTKPVVSFQGEMKRMDSYWAEHPLAGVKKFTVKTDNILCLVDEQ